MKVTERVMEITETTHCTIMFSARDIECALIQYANKNGEQVQGKPQFEFKIGKGGQATALMHCITDIHTSKEERSP